MVERHGGKVLTRQVYETSWLPQLRMGSVDGPADTRSTANS